MKKFAAVLAFGAAMLTGSAFAHTIENAYGNTIVVTLDSGAAVRYFFEPDGSFTATAPDGTGLRGNWEIANEQICFISPSTQRSCAPFVADKNVGDSWEQLDADGNHITVSLQAGR